MTNDNFMFKVQLSWMYLNAFVYIDKLKEFQYNAENYMVFTSNVVTSLPIRISFLNKNYHN